MAEPEYIGPTCETVKPADAPCAALAPQSADEALGVIFPDIAPMLAESGVPTSGLADWSVEPELDGSSGLWEVSLIPQARAAWELPTHLQHAEY
jgi:hypothetical protein